MKLTFAAVLVVLALNNAFAMPKSIVSDKIAEIDEFVITSERDSNEAFFALVSESDNKLRLLRERLVKSNTGLSTAVDRFAFNKLTSDLEERLRDVIRMVQRDQSATINYAQALTTFTPNDANQSPADVALMTMIREVRQVQATLRSASQDCTTPLAPQVIPSVQPFTDEVVYAANVIRQNINNQYIASILSVNDSEDAASGFANYLDICGNVANPSNCINNFVSSSKTYSNFSNL